MEYELDRKKKERQVLDREGKDKGKEGCRHGRRNIIDKIKAHGDKIISVRDTVCNSNQK